MNSAFISELLLGLSFFGTAIADKAVPVVVLTQDRGFNRVDCGLSDVTFYHKMPHTLTGFQLRPADHFSIVSTESSH
jgi:hypothetical protein